MHSKSLLAIIGPMEIDKKRIDEATLGLLWLTLQDDQRAWKGHDWNALNRLHEQGLIDDPVNKAKSVFLTEKGLARAEAAFRALFTRQEDSSD